MTVVTSRARAQAGKTGLMAAVNNLLAPIEEWTCGGVPIASMMNIERRKGKDKPARLRARARAGACTCACAEGPVCRLQVIAKALVDLRGAPFLAFAAKRGEWALGDRYRNPGPIQFEVRARSRVGARVFVRVVFSCACVGPAR